MLRRVPIKPPIAVAQSDMSRILLNQTLYITRRFPEYFSRIGNRTFVGPLTESGHKSYGTDYVNGHTIVITDTLLVPIIRIPCPKSIDIDSGLWEIKYLYTSWSSMTDDENCILWSSHWHQLHYNSYYHARPQNPWYEFLYQSVTKGKTHYQCDLNCSMLVSKDRRCIFLPVFPQGGRFVCHRVGAVCLQTDKTQCLYVHEVMRTSKWSEKLKYRFTGLSAFQLIP